MSVLIQHAKFIYPGSDFHEMIVDIGISDNGHTINISNADLKEHPAIIVDGKKVWHTEETTEEALCVAPGFVDVFADYREPGFEQKETIASGLRAAAAGGFTDVLLAPNTKPAIATQSGVQYVLQRASGSVVRLHPLGAITQDIEGKSLAEMLDMRTHGAIGFTDGWHPVQNTNLMLKAMEYAKSFDGVLLQIPLDASLAAGGLMHEGVLSTRLGMAGIPVLAETIMIHRDLELLRYTNSKLHITGVSTAEGVNMIRAAKAEGLNVTCSATPYHLALSDEALSSYDSVYKVSPVLRSENDRQALIAALSDGTIDCIASHHRPQDWDSKAKEFEYAGEGMNLQELAFNVVWQALREKVSLERLVDAFSIQPRKIFGLQPAVQNEGMISLTIFSPGSETDFHEANIKSLSRNNPFIGGKLSGKILGIFSRNQLHLNR